MSLFDYTLSLICRLYLTDSNLIEKGIHHTFDFGLRTYPHPRHLLQSSSCHLEAQKSSIDSQSSPLSSFDKRIGRSNTVEECISSGRRSGAGSSRGVQGTLKHCRSRVRDEEKADKARAREKVKNESFHRVVASMSHDTGSPHGHC